MTETKFLAGLANNIGFFELTTLVLLVTTLSLFHRYGMRIRFHKTIYVLSALVTIVAISTIKLNAASMSYGIVQLLIMVFALVLVIVLYNILTLNERYFDIFMRCIAYSAAIVAFWVIIDQAASGGSYSAAGPFRNRAHTGIVMHTSFWLVLFFSFKTAKSKVERLFFFAIVLPMIFYCIAVALRQSIYVALSLGILGLLVGVFLERSLKGISLIVPPLVAFCVAFLLYFGAGEDWSAIRLFRISADATTTELRGYFGESEEAPEGFSAIQRRGILRAVSEHPFIGVGWAGFGESAYAPTGHEVHSTPFRFLAETGIIGFTIYLFFILRLFWGGLKMWIVSRKLSNSLAALVLLVGFCSLTVSHIYNRAVTERTFWLFLSIFLAYDAILHRKIAFLNRQQRQQAASS